LVIHRGPSKTNGGYKHHLSDTPNDGNREKNRLQRQLSDERQKDYRPERRRRQIPVRHRDHQTIAKHRDQKPDDVDPELHPDVRIEATENRRRQKRSRETRSFQWRIQQDHTRAVLAHHQVP